MIDALELRGTLLILDAFNVPYFFHLVFEVKLDA